MTHNQPTQTTAALSVDAGSSHARSTVATPGGLVKAPGTFPTLTVACTLLANDPPNTASAAL